MSNVRGTNNEQEVRMVGKYPETAYLTCEATPLPVSTIKMNTTTRWLAETFKANLMKYFHDLSSVYIVYERGNFDVQLTFVKNTAPVEGDKIENLVRTIDKYDHNSIYAMKQRQSVYRSGKEFSLTDETKLFLSPFMAGPNNNRKRLYADKFFWDKLIEEKFDTQMNRERNVWGVVSPENKITYVTVHGIDINKVASWVLPKEYVGYCEKGEDGTAINHMIPIIKTNVQINPTLLPTTINPQQTGLPIIIESITEEAQRILESISTPMEHSGTFMGW